MLPALSDLDVDVSEVTGRGRKQTTNSVGMTRLFGGAVKNYWGEEFFFSSLSQKTGRFVIGFAEAEKRV